MLLCLVQSDYRIPKDEEQAVFLATEPPVMNDAHAEGRMPGQLLRQHAVRFTEIYDPPTSTDPQSVSK
jgi:hypothetical protein